MEAAATALVTLSTTPPTSDLWLIDGSSVFMTTGNPMARAAAAASSGEETCWLRGVGMP